MLLPGIQVKKERSALIQREKLKPKTACDKSTAPQRLQRFRPVANPPVSPYSTPSNAAGSSFPKDEDSSSLVSTMMGPCSLGSDGRSSASRSRRTPRLSREGSGNPVLEGETQRLEALKRRRFVELQQMLAFQLRSLAREVNQAVCGVHPIQSDSKKTLEILYCAHFW